jgi:hypothetical protein
MLLKERLRRARFSGVAQKRVGVMPARERSARAKLFDALERALDVRFEGREAGDHDGLDAALLLPAAAAVAARLPPWLPRLVAAGEERAPLSWSSHESNPPAAGRRVVLGRRAPLDARLRGQRLGDAGAQGVPALPTEPGQTVLAERHDGAVWLSRTDGPGRADVVVVAPAELADEECMRERVRDGRFLAVVALVDFVRDVCPRGLWQAPPPLRACFLFDDPNLHWRSYGHLRYPELVAHADRHGYHVALATVPLDGWFVHPATAELFRKRADRLSLLAHGNDHTRLELARPTAPGERRALLAQAVRRIAAFERRSGIPVARVMAAPHGVCSEEIARELVPTGFEALCISRPFPWLARRGRPWLSKPPGASPLTGWGPASIVSGGLPVILRRSFEDPDEDLALRAFLDQPLIVYGHHGDVRDGLGRLEELAARIGRLGDVRWMSPREMLATNVETRREGDVLRVRMFSRRATLDVPPGVARLSVEFQPLDGQPRADEIESVSDLDGAQGRTVELRLLRANAHDLGRIAAPPVRRWAIARRLLSEGRDRLSPAYRRVSPR